MSNRDTCSKCGSNRTYETGQFIGCNVCGLFMGLTENELRNEVTALKAQLAQRDEDAAAIIRGIKESDSGILIDWKDVNLYSIYSVWVDVEYEGLQTRHLGHGETIHEALSDAELLPAKEAAQ